MEPLVYEVRGQVLDLIHAGHLCVVDERGNTVFSAGEPDTMAYFRSSSKPIQVLPVIAAGLDLSYGITEEESAIFAASHLGEPFHIRALESIFQKAGLCEDQLVMDPAAPAAVSANEERLRAGLPKRKLYHNCSGKHAALMLRQRALGGEVSDYWRMDAPVQREVMRVMSVVSETREIERGVDGCGVPVFATPLKNIAVAFKNLACPEQIREDSLAEAAANYIPRMHDYPLMISGTGRLCSLLNADPDIVAKGGANGMYAFGLKKERLGVACKVTDGTSSCFPLIVWTVLEGLGCLSEQTRAALLTLEPTQVYNDNRLIVGEKKPAFHIG